MSDFDTHDYYNRNFSVTDETVCDSDIHHKTNFGVSFMCMYFYTSQFGNSLPSL